ncbi:MAG: PBP1A family penicillin-binding protein [Magnetococcales bacterium]|nr:PBP1A family penicillin-binding protein [Magnetococcales bacterium]
MWKLFKWLFILSFVAAIAGAGGVAAIFWHYSRDLPPLKNLADYRPNLVTRVFARDYQLMGEFFVERRQFVPLAEMPELLTRAFLAIEDTRFYDHPGIDIMSIARAAVANLRAQRTVQGASTITQQVAKTFLLSSERTLERKVKEVILSYRIEQRFAKSEILELYVNQIYLGAGAYGVGAASRIYFNRDVTELTLGQMALLAGLPKAPSRYDPWRNPDAARQRQKLVLGRMAEAGFVSQEDADAAAAAPLALARPWTPLEQVAPYYLEHVRRTIMEDWGQELLYRGGLDVYTTLDPNAQRAAHAAVRHGLVAYDRRHGYRGPLERLTSMDRLSRETWLAKHRSSAASASEAAEGTSSTAAIEAYYKALVLKVAPNEAELLLADGKTIKLNKEGVSWARRRLGKGKGMAGSVNTLHDAIAVGDVVLVERKGSWRLAQDPDVEGALVALDPHTGEILALVGGYDFARSEFNRATQGQRQPGSSFKPFVYAAALDNGFSPVSIVDDSPLPVPYRDPETGQTKIWMPQNYEHTFMGPTTLRIALEHSRNLVTIRLVKSVGVPAIGAYLNKFGLSVPDSRLNLTIALGTAGFPPLQMASGYAAFANGGKLVKPVYIARIQDRFGRTVHRHGGGDCLLCHVEPERGMLNRGEQEQKSQFGTRAIPAQTAYQITNLLKGVITHGTAQEAKSLNRPLAGKTGTTNDFRDAWFVGYSPSLVVAVWVGYDDYTSLGAKETGARAALPIWIEFMREALKSQPVTDFLVPAGIHLEMVEPHSGRSPAPGAGRVVLEAFRDGQGPLAGPIAVETTTPRGGGDVEEEAVGGMETSPAGGNSVPAGSPTTPSSGGWGDVRGGGRPAVVAPPPSVPSAPYGTGTGRTSNPAQKEPPPPRGAGPGQMPPHQGHVDVGSEY